MKIREIKKFISQLYNSAYVSFICVIWFIPALIRGRMIIDNVG